MRAGKNAFHQYNNRDLFLFFGQNILKYRSMNITTSNNFDRAQEKEVILDYNFDILDRSGSETFLSYLLIDISYCSRRCSLLYNMQHIIMQ